MSDGRPGVQDARARYLMTEHALVRIREDLKVYGVQFSWKRIRVRTSSGRVERRLMATLKGQVDADARGRVDDQGRQALDASRHSAYQAGAFALTLVSALFPNGLTQGGPISPDGSWTCLVWLDASDADVKKREAESTAAL